MTPRIRLVAIVCVRSSSPMRRRMLIPRPSATATSSRPMLSTGAIRTRVKASPTPTAWPTANPTPSATLSVAPTSASCASRRAPTRVPSGQTLKTIATSSTSISSPSISGSTSSVTSTTRPSPQASMKEATNSSVQLSIQSSGTARSIQPSRRATSPVPWPQLVCTRISR